MDLLKRPIIQTLLALIAISAIITAVRLATLPEGLNQYGYDYGFYSNAAEYTVSTLEYFLGQDNDYGNHLFSIMSWLRLPSAAGLETSFIIFSILAGWLIYFNLKKYSLLAAAAGVLLFTLSVPQTLAASMFLWKNLYGQVLLLIIFYLLQNKKTFWELIPLALLFITHKTTSLIAITATAGHYLVNQPTKYRWLLIAILTTALLAFLFLFNGYEYLSRLAQSSVSSGIFIKPTEYLIYSWYLLLLAGWGVYQSYKQKLEIHWLVMLIVCVAVILAQGLFYQRLIFFVDLALLFFSALTIHYWKLPNVQKIIVVIVVGFVAAWNLHSFTSRIEPRISSEQIAEIQKFSEQNQGAFILAISAQDGPWLLANLGGNIRLAAPGLFEDKHTAEEWKNYWINPRDQDFLHELPRPLYLYQRSSVVYQEPWTCLEQTSEHLYKYVCN
jgi:hypothetical protein